MDGCAVSMLCSEKCEKDGKCSITTEFAGEWFYRCYVGDQESCAQSTGCLEGGKCHYEPSIARDKCLALTHQDCLESPKCKNEGRCTLMQGRCGISDAGCTRSDVCRKDGKCHLKVRDVPLEGIRNAYTRKQTCVAKDVPDDQWCKKACESSGACVRRGNECVATEREHCENSFACTRHGLCSVGESGACVAESDEDCAQSRYCDKYGKCVVAERGTWCIDSNDVCSGSCEHSGACTPYKGVCKATRDSDCAASEICRLDGRCAVHNGRCWPMADQHCRESRVCRTIGACTHSGLACKPSKAAHCEESLACEIAGLCSLWKHGTFDERRCHAASPEDCAQSIECKEFGRCVPKFLPNCTRPGCRQVCAKPTEPARLSCVETRYCKNDRRCLRLDIPSDGTPDGPWPKSQDCSRHRPE
jgi:hypothetical protein